MNLNWMDFLFLLIFAGAVIYGIFSGFVMQLAHVLALALGVFAAGRIGPHVGDALGHVFSSETVCRFLGFGIVFVAVALGVTIIAYISRATLRAIPITGTADRVLGALAAALAAFLLCLAITLSAVQAGAEAPKQSRVAPALVRTGKAAKVFSEDQRDNVEDFLDGLKDWKDKHF